VIVVMTDDYMFLYVRLKSLSSSYFASDGQSASLKPMTRYLLISDNYVLHVVGSPT
jgi:hypothetical protein